MVSVKFLESAVPGRWVWRDASAGDDAAREVTAIEIAPVIGNLCEPRQVLSRASADLQKRASKR